MIEAPFEFHVIATLREIKQQKVEIIAENLAVTYIVYLNKPCYLREYCEIYRGPGVLEIVLCVKPLKF